MDGVVAGDDLALGEHILAAVAIADETAGLAQQNEACRDVPGLDVALPIAIETAGRDPGEVERGGAEAAQPRDLLLHGAGFPLPKREIAAAMMGKSAGDHGLGKAFSAGNADALLVHERAFALLGDEHLFVGRIVDQAGDHRAFAFERDRNRELRNAVQEIGGAVERVDDPAMRLVGAVAMPPSSPRKP